jgi:hypothetical protein
VVSAWSRPAKTPCSTPRHKDERLGEQMPSMSPTRVAPTAVSLLRAVGDASILVNLTRKGETQREKTQREKE